MSDLAYDDLVRLADFLAPKSPRAWKAAVSAISDRMKSLGRLSERGHLSVDGNVREMLIRFGQAGYVLQYRVTADTVLVLRIFHSREER